MSIQAISNNVSNPISLDTNTKTTDGAKKDTFDKFLNTISSMEENQTNTQNSVYDLLTTGKGDSQDVLLAMQKATSQIKTASVVRDKLIESYNSLINMQI